MPNKIEPGDSLYRCVRPKHHNDDHLMSDAFDDKYENQSFMLASICMPRQILAKFAQYPGAKKLCNKSVEDPVPTCEEMYNAGYRIAITSVEIVRVKLDIKIELEADGSEYRSDGHVNLKQAKLKAALLAEPGNSRVLTKEETLVQ